MKILYKSEIYIALKLIVLGILLFYSLPAVLSVYKSLPPSYNSMLKDVGYIISLAMVSLFIIRQLKKKTPDSEIQDYNLFNNNPAPLAIIKTDTLQFLAVNKAACEYYGYSVKEFLLMTVNDLRIDEEVTPLFDGITLPVNSKYAGIKKHKKKNGEVIIVEITSSDVVFKGKKCNLHLVRDITQLAKAIESKKIAEEETLKQKTFTEFVLHNFPVDVAIFDKDHRYILLNKIAIKNNETREWLIGKDDFDYFRLKGTDMSIAEKRRKRFNKAVAGESEEWIDEYMIEGKKKYMLRKFYPYWENGTLSCVYGYGMDITEVKKAQIQKDEYIHQLETLAFATSHKIRQPICNIQGLIYLLIKNESGKDDFKNIIDGMANSIESLDEFTRELADKLHAYKEQLKRTENQQLKS